MLSNDLAEGLNLSTDRGRAWPSVPVFKQQGIDVAVRTTEGRLEVVIVKCESSEGGEVGQEVAVGREKSFSAGTMLSLCMFLNQARRAASFS